MRVNVIILCCGPNFSFINPIGKVGIFMSVKGMTRGRAALAVWWEIKLWLKIEEL